MINHFKTIILTFLIMLTPMLNFAQDNFKNEEAMVKKANELFQNEEYVKAYEYYQTLLSNHRDNAEYSYRFGVCMMFSDKRDKSKPIKYLERAAATPGMDIKVFYFLGRAYHQNYRFNDAKLNYERYKNLAKSKVVAKYNIDRRIQECENGLALLSHIHLLYVVNKVEVKEATFYRTYNMNNSGGMVIMKPDELKTKYDKKHNTDRTAFYVPSNRILYFSSYGLKGVNGKDIYRAHQLSDGSWSEPEKLSASINTPYDEAYPFITLDGQTLYFSSKGHNSMGGYDIFKSVFNTGSFDWSKAENLNFPINTPFDDIFFVPDTMNKFASFSSTRSSVDGLIYVYKIGLNRQEEEQDFAKVLTEGGDITAAVNLIKDVADLKTNINVDEYKKKIAKITDTTLAINSQPNPQETKTTPAEANADLANFDTQEAVDSVFGIYKDMKYRVVGFKKQKKSIQEIYHYNKLKAQTITKEQGVAGATEAAKYKKAADVALEIRNKIDHEIKQTEQASEKIMEMAGNIQYYDGRGMKDSVKSIYDQAINLNNSVAVNTDIAKEVVDAQYIKVKDKREQASKFYDLSKSYDKQINDLKAERDEYAAEAARLTDPDVKQEYIDLVEDMNKDIAKKEAEKASYYNKWKATRDAADSLSNQLAMVDDVINNYNAQTKEVDFNTYAFVDDKNRQEVENKIAVKKGVKPTEVVAVNDANTKETNNQNTDLNKPNPSGVKAAGVTVAADGLGANNKKAAVENDTKETSLVTNWKDNPEAVAIVKQANESISKLDKSLTEQKAKAQIAKTLANKKYNEYQKLSQSTEAKLSKINTNTNLSIDERNRQLSTVKKEMVDANNYKKEAAAAFMIAAQYEKKESEINNLITEAKNKKTEVEALLAQGKISEAKLLNNQIKSLENSNSTQAISSSKTQAQITKLSSDYDALQKKEDEVKSELDALKVKRSSANLNPEEISQIDSDIKTKEEELHKISSKIDLVGAKKDANLQIVKTEQSIQSSYAKGGSQNVDIAALKKIPAEFQNRGSLVGVFSKQVLDQKIETVDSYLKTAVVAQKPEKNTLAKQQDMSNLEIPVYPNDDQNQVAAKILKPRVEAIKSYEEQNNNLDKRITASLIMAKDYNSKLKSKKIEIQEAYSKIDTTKALSDQKSIVSKIENLEKEALELNKKQESAMQFANILKSHKEDNNNQVDQLQLELKQAKGLIAQNNIPAALEKTSSTKVISVNPDISSKELTSGYVNNYTKLNKDLDIKIASAEKKLVSVHGEERKQLETKISKLKAQKQRNSTLIASVEEQASYMDTKANLDDIDSNMIAKAVKVPIVAVNNEIFSPDYLQDNSPIKKMISQEQKEIQEAQVAQNESNEMQPVDHISNVDVPLIKRDLLIAQVSLLDDQIAVLSQRKAQSDDLNEKQDISRSIRDLESKKNALNKQIANTVIDQDEVDIAYYNPKKMNLDEAIAGLKKQNADLIAKEKQLRSEAESLHGKAKKEKLAEADKTKEISMKLNLEVVEIIALNNKRKYRENELQLARFSEDQLNDIRARRAIANIRFAKQNMAAGQARREMASEDGYSDLERKNILDEAVTYENKAIKYQKDALKIYDNLGIVAVVNPQEVIAENAVDTARAAEEIPSDNGVEVAKAQNKTQTNTSTKAAVAVPVYGIVFNSDTASGKAAPIVDNAQVTPKGLVYKVQMATYKKNATLDEFNGIQPVAAEKVDNSENIHYVAGTFANYNDAVKAREAIKEKGFPEAFVVAYFDGKHISTNEARKLIAEGKAYTDPELAKYASEHNSEYYTQQIASNEKTVSPNASAQSQNKGANNSVQVTEAKTNVVVPVVVAAGVNNNNSKKTIPSDSNTTKTNEAIQNTETIAKTEENSNAVVPVVVPSKADTNKTEEVIAQNETTTEVLVPVDSEKQTDTTKKDVFDVPQEVEKPVVVKAQSVKDETQNQQTKEQPKLAATETVSSNKPVNTTVNTTNLGITYSQNTDNSENIADNSKLTPQGLVYKVQMAAFRNEVPMSTFKGISPVAAEHAPNSAYIRYVAGVFPNYNSAVSARNIIRTKGFKDAFVVVYFNGKRISVGDARQLIAMGEAYTSEGLSQFAINNNTAYYTKNNKGSQLAENNNNAQDQQQENNVIPNEVIAKAPVQQGDIPIVTLYYSVQVGVFGGPRSAERLYNISGLFFDRTASGYYRYFAGKFDNEQSAKSSRDRIRMIGIRDAFVVAFRNGQRISLASARKLEQDARNNLVVLKREKSASTTIASNTNQNINNQNIVVNQADNAAEGIVFKVQLGAYRGTRNQEQLQFINSMSENGISSYTTASGLTIYFTNSYKTYNEARAARNRIVAAGHTDVFVVAMQNGKKINLRRAMDLLKQ